MLKLSDFNYTLPEHLIAQTPASPSDSCGFLIVDKKKGDIQDKIFSDITSLLDPNTLIVFNNSKVLKTRLILPNETEIFFLSSLTTFRFKAMVGPGKKFIVGSIINFVDEITFTVDEIIYEGRVLTCSHPILEVLEKYGQMPFPPYLNYKKELEKSYQSVFASQDGSAAAPTASLHFTKSLLEQIEKKGIETCYTTLHIGLGTFKPIQTEDIGAHKIHSEEIEISSDVFTKIASKKANSHKILAVGTTVTRTLESLPYLWKLIQSNQLNLQVSKKTKTYRDNLSAGISLDDAYTIINLKSFSPTSGMLNFDSSLFLYPGKKFHIIDELITNFHLPQSTLLMLVSGFMGFENMKKTYEYAIEHSYRFYSFGDAMRIKT